MYFTYNCMPDPLLQTVLDQPLFNVAKWFCKKIFFPKMKGIPVLWRGCKSCSRTINFPTFFGGMDAVWPDWAIYWTLGNFSKPLASINMPKSFTFLGNFCWGVKSYHFSCEIIFGQLLWIFGNLFWSYWMDTFKGAKERERQGNCCVFQL